jgi:gluconokinase
MPTITIRPRTAKKCLEAKHYPIRTVNRGSRACSALKEKYRDILVGNLEGVVLVFLRGDAGLIAERMRQREHFMPVSLLETQLATLEPPSNAIIVDIAQPIETMLEQVIAQLGQ